MSDDHFFGRGRSHTIKQKKQKISSLVQIWPPSPRRSQIWLQSSPLSHFPLLSRRIQGSRRWASSADPKHISPSTIWRLPETYCLARLLPVGLPYTTFVFRRSLHLYKRMCYLDRVRPTSDQLLSLLPRTRETHFSEFFLSIHTDTDLLQLGSTPMWFPLAHLLTPIVDPPFSTFFQWLSGTLVIPDFVQSVDTALYLKKSHHTWIRLWPKSPSYQVAPPSITDGPHFLLFFRLLCGTHVPLSLWVFSIGSAEYQQICSCGFQTCDFDPHTGGAHFCKLYSLNCNWSYRPMLVWLHLGLQHSDWLPPPLLGVVPACFLQLQGLWSIIHFVGPTGAVFSFSARSSFE